MGKYTFFLDNIPPRKLGKIVVIIVGTLFLLFIIVMLIMGVQPIQDQLKNKNKLNTPTQELSL